MRAYPYAAADAPPAVLRAAEQAEAWNTRPVVRPIVPMELFALGTMRVPVDSSRDGGAARDE
jgi:hypothetical protein